MSHKLIERLRKIKRVHLEHMLRKEDDTTAFYCFDLDEIRLFIDVALDDCKNHYNAWGASLTLDFAEFVAKFLDRIVLHELFHWCDIESDRQCEYLAISLVWNKGAAKIVSGWQYPDQKLANVPEVEIEDVS